MLRQLTKHRRAIGVAFVVLVAAAMPWIVNEIQKRQLIRRTEADFRKLMESNSDCVFSYYPEILERIAKDNEAANRINLVHLTYVEKGGDYSSLALLPNVEEIQVTYSQNVTSVLPALNRMPSLKRAMFAHCETTDEWLGKLISPTLESLTIHNYEPVHISNDTLEMCEQNIPGCSIEFSDDSEF